MTNGNVANIINHVGLLLDASSSMGSHSRQLVAAVDKLVQRLAARSQEVDQETRITVWTFSSGRSTKAAEVVVWDRDVLRLPSIASLYRTGGMTALVQSTREAIDDFESVPTRYGDHSFLLYVLTDGMENDSLPQFKVTPLSDTLTRLPDNWTVGVLVPDFDGEHEAKKFGFPAGNIARWDTSSADAATEVGERIFATADAYMAGRARGERSTRTLFSTGADAVNDQTIRQAGLTPLRDGSFKLWTVWRDQSIRDFVDEQLGAGRYVSGRAYYEHTKAETIQPQKNLAFMSKVDGQVYTGREARAMVGLPDMYVKVAPDFNPEYRIFVQSTSTNRRLKAGTQLLYML